MVPGTMTATMTTGDGDSTLLETPLLQAHKQLGAKLGPYAGYRMPLSYAGLKEEHRAVRERCGLFDVSHMGELLLSGPSALTDVNALITSDIRTLAVGHAKYTLCCREDGGILDDLIVYRLAEDRYQVVCNAANRHKIAAHFIDRVNCHARDVSDETSLIALQGPESFKLLSELGLSDVTSLPFFGVGRFGFLGNDITIAHTGYTGEEGVELFAPDQAAPKIWATLLEAGEALGIAPAGLGARNTLRLEARLSLYGNEIDESTDPFEAGLAWTVDLDGDRAADDFLGKAALIARRREGKTRRLVGFEMLTKRIARDGYAVMDAEGNVIGHVTSGSYAPTLDKNIGLAYVTLPFSKVGSEISVDIRGRIAPAKVVKTPFYRRPR